MSRRRKRLRGQTEEALNPYEGMSKDELAKLARSRGIRGVPEGWELETIIRKLMEADDAKKE